MAQRARVEMTVRRKIKGYVREEGRQVDGGVGADHRPRDAIAPAGLHDVKEHHQYDRANGITVDGHRDSQRVVHLGQGQPVVHIILEDQAEYKHDDDPHHPLALGTQVVVQPHGQQQGDQQHSRGDGGLPGDEALEKRHLLDVDFIVSIADDRQRAFVANALALRFAVADDHRVAHRQVPLRLVKHLAAVPQDRVAPHAVAHEDHRAIIGDAAAGIQRGVARDAAALHDQRAAVQNARAVVVESAGEHARADAVPEGEDRARPDVDHAPLALGLVGIHRAVEHMAVQVEHETLARRDGDFSIRIQRRQIPGQRNDLPVPGSVDGLLQGRPGLRLIRRCATLKQRRQDQRHGVQQRLRICLHVHPP